MKINNKHADVVRIFLFVFHFDQLHIFFTQNVASKMVGLVFLSIDLHATMKYIVTLIKDYMQVNLRVNYSKDVFF